MKNIFTTLCISALATASLASTSLADTVAIYDLEGKISEGGKLETNILKLAQSKRTLTHFDIIESLNAAITDDEVKAVVIDADSASLSLAQVQEIRRLLSQIRAAGKDVWVYTQVLNIRTALLGSVANHMTLLTEGNVSLAGMYSERMYFKNMLDNIGVKVEVIHIGDFKSAGETFYRTAPSEYAQKQSDKLMDSLYQQVISQIAKGRGISEEKMKQIIDQGIITPEQALEFKLVDHLDYRTDFVNTVRKKYGKKAKYDKGYELPNLDGPEINGVMDLLKLAFSKGNQDNHKTDYIAVISLDGAINDHSIAPVRTEILKATRSEHCKALVLRVNSPGGSALSSDVLWEATDEFKATGRPFIVSMGGVAASGGYYVSAAADRIYAEEGTITGSIGVVGMKFVFADALKKLGITTHSSKRGKHADLMNTTRSYTAEEEKMIRASMVDVYGTFKKRIIDGRGKRLKGDLEKLAGGRVYSGKDALAIGLVDTIGGLNEAINYAAKMAKLDQYETLQLPKPMSPMESLFRAGKPRGDQHEFIKMNAAPPAPIFSAAFLQSPALRLLGPEKQAQVIQFIHQAEAFRDQKVLLLAPAFNIQLR